MRIFDICRQLSAALEKGHLPGSESHLKMAPPTHTALPYSLHTENNSPSMREAAVLILISPPEEAPRIPLIIRADDGGAHSGQIAMPGGCREDGEAFPVETALREAHEEICLDPGLVKILGILTPLFIPVSNFKVTPVVAYVEQSVELRADGLEAMGVVWLDIEAILNDPLEGMFHSNIGGDVAALYYPAAGGNVWGATAMMLSEFADLLRNS